MPALDRRRHDRSPPRVSRPKPLAPSIAAGIDPAPACASSAEVTPLLGRETCIDELAHAAKLDFQPSRACGGQAQWDASSLSTRQEAAVAPEVPVW